jgi:hypothetical protein
MTSEQIRMLLNEKFKAEAKRLESWGTKHSRHSATSFAVCVAEFVRALMSYARSREGEHIRNHVMRMITQHGKVSHDRVVDYIEERIKATKQMSKAIENYAVLQESKRPINTKKEHHGKHKHKHSHRHH